jgi:hypothetical protein
VPLKAKVLLSPIERYKWYGVFPGKFLIHLVIVILASVISIDNNIMNEDIFTPQNVVFFFTFLSDGDGDAL